MLNWLFSSFTYLPNFIIWLPSFSSPWLVQLASKCHLAIFAFVRFLDLFHSVKKVPKPSIFICVSKRTLVILARMLYCAAFFKAKNFVIFFSFIFMIYKWGGDFIGGNFPSVGGFSQGAIFSGEKFWGVFSEGAIFLIPIMPAGIIQKFFFLCKRTCAHLDLKENKKTLCVVTIAMICSILASLWKFQYFWRPIYNPVEHRWWSFYCKNSKPLSIFTKKLHHRCLLVFQIRLCFLKTL